MSSTQEGNETIDLGARLSHAVAAARRGDLHALEIELAGLRQLDGSDLGGMATRLRGIAKAVRLHPSFGDASAAQAG